MLVIPAIDIKDGKVVRLLQGKYEEVTIYSQDPISVAQRWQEEGASLIHVVDLDGALEGKLKNIDVVSEIVKNIDIPIELGGGIRNKSDIDMVVSRGVSRVILGTKACSDEEFIKKIISEFGERIIISIDAKYDKVATQGWTETLNISTNELAKRMQDLGAKHIVYTDISRDGTLRGPNIEGISSMLKMLNISLIASGGVSSIEDIRALKNLEDKGLCGVIVGKALYENKIDLAKTIKEVG